MMALTYTRFLCHTFFGLCLISGLIVPCAGQDTPKIRFTLKDSPNIELDLPADKGGMVETKGGKPFQPVVIMRLYRIHIQKGYDYDLKSPMEMSPGGITGLELRQQAQRNSIRNKINDLQTPEVERLQQERLKPQNSCAELVAQDTASNSRHVFFLLAKAPESLQLTQVGTLASLPNVKLVGAKGSIISLLGKDKLTLEKSLQDNGRWHFDMFKVKQGGFSTVMTQVTVEWKLQVTVDPKHPQTSPLQATFTGAPDPSTDSSNPPVGGGNGTDNAGAGSADTGKPLTTDAQKPDTTPQAVSTIATLFGLAPGTVTARPGIDVVAGIAIPDNGPTAMAGVTLYEDRRGDNSAPLSLNNLFGNLGLTVGHTLGNSRQSAYIFGPSLRIGSSAWIYAGGAASDSNGTTRLSFVAGATISLGDILGKGKGNGANTSASANVEVEPNDAARIGPPSSLSSYGVLTVTEPVPDPTKPPKRKVDIYLNGKKYSFNYKYIAAGMSGGQFIETYPLPVGTITKIDITNASGEIVASYQSGPPAVLKNLTVEPGEQISQGITIAPCATNSTQVKITLAK